MAAEEECEECEGGGEWMATFADLSTLLLTFFVLLLSFSNMDVVAFREMLGSVREAFGVQKQIHGSIEAIASSPVELSMNQNDGAGMSAPQEREAEEKKKKQHKEMYNNISKYVANHEMQDDVEVELSPRGVILRVKEGALYRSGSAELDDESRKLLDNIAEMQQRYSDAVQIEGHTDNMPINSRKFPSNWELSTARAISALQYLKDEKGVSASKMGVAGYADSKPLETNATPEGRMRNRRLEFVFKREAGTPAPPGDQQPAADSTGDTDDPKADTAEASRVRAFAVPMSGGGGPRKSKKKRRR